METILTLIEMEINRAKDRDEWLRYHNLLKKLQARTQADMYKIDMLLDICNEEIKRKDEEQS